MDDWGGGMDGRTDGWMGGWLDGLDWGRGGSRSGDVFVPLSYKLAVAFLFPRSARD